VFPSIPQPYVGELDIEFEVNYMGGACGYMVIVGFTEYWPTEGTF
jgi:hypothetical protein